jgi:hypothetical protein
MKFLFFSALLAIASALPLSHLIKDPKTLMATLANADPGAVDQLQEYVDTLIKEGEADEAMYTQNRDDAQAAFDGRTADLEAADAALKAAKQVHEEKTAKEAAAAADELSKRSIRKSKRGILNEKTSFLDEAKETNINEQARLDREKALFNEIKGLLTRVRANVEVGRHLLSEADADPAQVDAALGLLNDLIAEGEVERQALIDAEAAAQTAFEVAKGIHAEAVAVHTLAEGALEDAKLEWRDAKAVLDLRTQEHRDATAAKQAALDNLNAHQDKLDQESARIASEKLDLEMIRDLLARLE